jgi:hypothetical protein
MSQRYVPMSPCYGATVTSTLWEFSEA